MYHALLNVSINKFHKFIIKWDIYRNIYDKYNFNVKYY